MVQALTLIKDVVLGFDDGVDLDLDVVDLDHGVDLDLDLDRHLDVDLEFDVDLDFDCDLERWHIP